MARLLVFATAYTLAFLQCLLFRKRRQRKKAEVYGVGDRGLGGKGGAHRVARELE